MDWLSKAVAFIQCAFHAVVADETLQKSFLATFGGLAAYLLTEQADVIDTALRWAVALVSIVAISSGAVLSIMKIIKQLKDKGD